MRVPSDGSGGQCGQVVASDLGAGVGDDGDAAAKPHSQDGIDVISVRAHPRTKPAPVWQAVDEVVAVLDDGALWHAERPGGLQADGFGWRVRTARVQMTEGERSRLLPDVMGRPHQ